MSETTIRTATCRCGQLRATCHGDSVRVSVCHCLDCQKRSGSALGAQARWPDDRVELAGAFNDWTNLTEAGLARRSASARVAAVLSKPCRASPHSYRHIRRSDVPAADHLGV